jgi:hypothetical protein
MLKNALYYSHNISKHHQNHYSSGGVRDGNGGIDLRVNFTFLPCLQAVDDPNFLLGDETLSDFGETDITSLASFGAS